MRESGNEAGRRNWLIAFALVVLAGVVVPYGILGGAEAPGFAVALFWLIFGFVVVALITVGVARWKD
jgi:uncharacterized membrane protein YhaH (DUF805 family)